MKQVTLPTEAPLKPQLAPELPVAQVAKGSDFTGVARSIEAYQVSSSGIDFKNFKVVTLHIEKGKVVRAEYSDPYASFEVLLKMEFANELSLHHLNNRWSPGKALEK